jgi:hypothetical protein
LIAQAAVFPDPVIGSSLEALIPPSGPPLTAETPTPVGVGVGVRKVGMVGWGLWSA